MPEPQKKTSDSFQKPLIEDGMNLSELKAVSTANLSGEVLGQPKATNVVCMVDFDDTLAGFDYTVNLEDYIRILFGGEKTVDVINTLKEKKESLSVLLLEKMRKVRMRLFNFLKTRK